ncbi:family 78 glycoside hydrolase catalytic domain [Nocardioides bruguierae]|uniref:family 78 glycoside hydrolase catalytic domain n=1 Tax=Nocardioides bruguierae TaxID=2945102 RepID=UPI002021D6B9|nr:alpha-L-rhamnosidase [Nocardioides bruguierae]MCL8026674.1 glycoside hydrolase family 78 protein [Nocardioides bruguierae]
MTSPLVSAPTVEHHREALGIGETRPRLSFVVDADASWRQRSYEVELDAGGVTTTSGWVEDDDSVLRPWPFAPLGSREAVRVRVRVWGEHADPSDWSGWTHVEIGLLEPGDWSAVMVGPLAEVPVTGVVRLRRELDLPAPVASARLYVTAHGVTEVELNGRRVGEDAFAPGWTSYPSRLRYLTYDVTEHLHEGANAIGAWLADGWYRGRLGFHGGRAERYGDTLGLLAQLEVTLADGSTVTLGTDESWAVHDAPITATSLYDGETHDARAADPDWSTAGWAGEPTGGVRVLERDPATLVAPDGPPVRCAHEVAPVAAWTAPSGAVLLDFGQNLVGRLRITVAGDAGEQVRLRHAEVLQDGELYTRPLRFADATDTLVLAGREETWEPRFTFHGFRYAEVTGWPGGTPETIQDAVVARVLHTGMEAAGEFACSEPDVNRLHANVVWSMRGNTLEVPTDCPQRDERLGWTGDIQAFAPTAAFLYRCTGMLAGWLRDLAAEQEPDGNVPWYVPYIDTTPQWTPPKPGAVWGDAAVLTPWDLFTATGDTDLLARQLESGRRWVDLVDRLAGPTHLWTKGGQQLGDWLDPAAPPEDPAAAVTDPALVATAFFAQSARRLADTADVLGLEDVAGHYRSLAGQVREAFLGRWRAEDGTLTEDTQTALALAICFDLLDEADLPAAGERLAALVAKAENRIATGFAGTPLVTEALSRTGQDAAAYDLLLERGCPSWLYAVSMGATTIWERWDSMLPDGTVNPGEMTSFNHYALGAVADWLHRRVAGLAPAAPGWREIRVEPRPGGGLTHASAAHLTPYGRASVAWQVDADGALSVEATLPTGTTGTVLLPGGEPVAVGPGTHTFTA